MFYNKCLFCRLFCPKFHGKVVRKITEIYEGKYDVAYPSWGKIPQSVRDMCFNELKASNLKISLELQLFISNLLLKFNSPCHGLHILIILYDVF